MFFKYIMKKIKYMNHLSKSETRNDYTKESIKFSLNENIKYIKEITNDSVDIKYHEIILNKSNLKINLIFLDGLVNMKILNDSVIKPITELNSNSKVNFCFKNPIESLSNLVIQSGETNKIYTYEEVFSNLFFGDTILLVDGQNVGLAINTKGWEKRTVTEPQSETVVRGPREGFTENIRTNTSLIRRKIRNPKLTVENMIIGVQTKTNISLMYLEGIANEKVLNKLKKRLKKICVQSILDAGYIEEYIEDAPFSPFATVGYSEKPDVVSSKILEGRIAILVDGTPFVLTVPHIFIENFQSAEDFYTRTVYASFTRALRYIAFLITVLSPGVYIAITTYHQELIPTTLLITIAKAREGTPFPAFIEALIMIFAFEILREGGIRLPKPTGQAISIVGALVMGEAAISAGFVGAPIVITIGLTAVAAFLIPTQNEAVSLLRLFIIILGAILGLFGIAIGCFIVLIHLSSLNSFGIPYFDGLSQFNNLKDSFIRVPLWYKDTRPNEISGDNKKKAKKRKIEFRPFEKEEEYNEKN